MKAYIVINENAPEECDRALVFAESEAAARATICGATEAIRCMEGDEFAPRGVISKDPHAMAAVGITPYEWLFCDQCQRWHQGEDEWRCDECWASADE